MTQSRLSQPDPNPPEAPIPAVIPKNRRFRLSPLLPILLIVIPLWLLIGCLYIPTGEMVFSTGSKQDFRSLVGSPDGSKPIVAKRISRAGVEAILGPPPYASSNGRRVMYVIHTKKDIWILPLCFEVTSDRDNAIGLLLNFDKMGLLERWDRLDASGDGLLILGGPGANWALQENAENNLLRKVESGNEHAPSSQRDDDGELRSTKTAIKPK
jgi:hypothetical protein